MTKNKFDHHAQRKTYGQLIDSENAQWKPLATSDPEADQQARTDHDADQLRAAYDRLCVRNGWASTTFEQFISAPYRLDFLRREIAQAEKDGWKHREI